MNAILYCPHLNRDIRGLLNAVPHPRILTGARTPKGEDGCLEGHKAIIRTAMAEGAERVFAMEDDCQFTEHFTYVDWMQKADWAEAHGYGAMAGGCVMTWDNKKVAEGLIEVTRFCSAHCMMYFERGYKYILEAVQPYDMTLGDCLNKVGIKCLVTWPFVAVQRPSYSGILDKNVNYLDNYVSHERTLEPLAKANI